MTRIEKAQYIIEAGIISIHPCNLGNDDGSIYWMSDEEIDMIYDDTIKAQGAKEATSTNESESKEEQTMKKYSIKPEYYDLWGAWEGNDTVTEEQIKELSKEWEKPIDELMEQVEEIEKEETTMKPTKSMTKSEAIREIATLSSSTLARICGSTNYSMIDDCSSKLILAASNMKEDAFAKCENWIDVLHTINASTDNDIDSPYLLGYMDCREYLNKYGHDEAVTILRNYIETITSEGIQNTKWEQDYIRGAKDMLAIA